MENVKGFELSETRDHFTQVLSEAGYQFQEFLLSPEQIGIPNSRLRYYLIATRGELPAPPTGAVLCVPPSGARVSGNGDGPAVAEGEAALAKVRSAIIHHNPPQKASEIQILLS